MEACHDQKPFADVPAMSVEDARPRHYSTRAQDITRREAGFDARCMAGGHYAWKAAGGKMARFV